MSAAWELLALSSSLLLVVLAQGGKYSKEANEAAAAGSPQRQEAGEFRVVKLNQIWEKAQRLHLSAVKLAELHSDLKIQEKDELSWKKLKAEGLDEDGEKEAKLRRNLHVIMTKYGMNGKKDAQLVDTNYIKDGTESDVLDDPRLEKLWSKAKTSGKFSDQELDKLWREFKHHKEKIHEYNILLETVSRTEEIHKNMINPSEEDQFKEEILHGKHTELKDKMRSINQGFDRLRKISHQGYDTASEFEEPRVIDLWDMAKSANFTEKELESFREELKHFEAKIEKHHHYQKQLEISHQKLKHVEGTGDKDHLSRNKEKYVMLEEKTKELGYKGTLKLWQEPCLVCQELYAAPEELQLTDLYRPLAPEKNSSQLMVIGMTPA
ncbi:alpha-2-macroglobulin receptor-associated protein isoform X1 [Mauremys reevesii]|uniref:alpha-2-macroglobulin receptor-associated protein isoform X1 n=1 Tax=Mauremys reevesii TaxID=260615 RepID=UPI00193F903E|nr:alpha-2-macroglobulin receptor-associated protein isoform X1 [Mauremys reevesii]